MSWTQKKSTAPKYKSRTLVHGLTGVGKTHFQNGAFPKPYWIDMDNSLTHKWAKLPKFVPNEYIDFVNLMEDMINEPKSPDVDTIIFDIDHIINQYTDALAGQYHWDHVEGEGYNHEWKIVKARARVKIFQKLEQINEKYHICLTSHSIETRVKSFENDITVTQMRPNIHKTIIDDVVNWVNTILYIHNDSDVFMKQIQGKERKFYVGKKRSKNTSRSIEVANSAHYEAKNRCDLYEALSFESNFNYEIITKAILGDDFDADNIDTGFIENSDNSDILSRLKEHEDAVLHYCINHYYSLKEGQTLDELTEKSINEISDDVERFIERSVEKFDEFNKRKNAGQEGMDI